MVGRPVRVEMERSDRGGEGGSEKTGTERPQVCVAKKEPMMIYMNCKGPGYGRAEKNSRRNCILTDGRDPCSMWGLQDSVYEVGNL